MLVASTWFRGFVAAVPLLCGVAVQERQRRGIQGMYVNSLDERLDQQQLQKLLGEVIRNTKTSLDGPAIDPQVLATVALSR